MAFTGMNSSEARTGIHCLDQYLCLTRSWRQGQVQELAEGTTIMSLEEGCLGV